MLYLILFHITSAILGVLIVTVYFPGFVFLGRWEEILFAGTIIGLINCFLKPVLKIIFLPFRIITLGFFTLAINIGLIWFVIEFIFKESFRVKGVTPFIVIAFLIWLFNLTFNFISKNK